MKVSTKLPAAAGCMMTQHFQKNSMFQKLSGKDALQ